MVNCFFHYQILQFIFQKELLRVFEEEKFPRGSLGPDVPAPIRLYEAVYRHSTGAAVEKIFHLTL